MSRRKPRPVGNLKVFCAGRGTHDRVNLRRLQLIRAGDEVRVQWDQRQGAAPVTDFRAADGYWTFSFECRTCGRHPKWHEPRLVEMARGLAVHQGLAGNDNSPIEMDISTVERA